MLPFVCIAWPQNWRLLSSAFSCSSVLNKNLELKRYTAKAQKRFLFKWVPIMWPFMIKWKPPSSAILLCSRKSGRNAILPEECCVTTTNNGCAGDYALLWCCLTGWSGGSNFRVCGWNPEVWILKWKSVSSSFLRCCLICCTRWF